MLPDLTVLIALLLGLTAIEGAPPEHPAQALLGTAVTIAVALFSIRATGIRAVGLVKTGEMDAVIAAQRWGPTWALTAWGLALFVFDWGGLVGAYIPRVFWLARLAILFLPAMLLFPYTWKIRGDIERVFFEHRRLPVPPGLSTPIKSAVRKNAIALFPMLAFIGLIEGLWVLGALGVTPLAEATRWVEAMPLLMLGSVMAIVLVSLPFIPWAFAKLLRTKPMPEGRLRRMLEQGAARIGLRYKDIVVWSVPMPNAMVVGFTPGTRRIFFTEGILETLTEGELMAVFFHEAGHAKRHHLPLLLLIFFSVGLVFHVLRVPLASLGVPPLILFAAHLAVLWYGVLGWVSRHFEREADVYGAEHASILTPDAGPVDRGVGVPVPLGAAQMANALGRVREISGHAKSHRHGSIQDRMDYVIDYAIEPAVRESFRTSRRHMLLGALALAAIAIFGAVRTYPTELAQAHASMAFDDAQTSYTRAFEIDYKDADGKAKPLWEAAYAGFIRAAAYLEDNDDFPSRLEHITALWDAGDTAMHGLLDAERARPHFVAARAAIGATEGLGRVGDWYQFQSDIELGRIAAWTGAPESDARRHLMGAESNSIVRGGADAEPDPDRRRYYGARLRLLGLTIDARYGGPTAPQALPKLRELTTSKNEKDAWIELRRDAQIEVDRLERLQAGEDG